MKDCIYVADTPRGHYCTLTNKECLNLFSEECEEPEWELLMRLAEDYIEDDSRTI